MSSVDSVAAEFDKQTGGIPAEITGEVIAPEAGGTIGEWTPEQVSGDFAAVFLLLQTVRGSHWEISEPKLQTLGVAWCPIFKRYIPFADENSEVLMWLGAIGALISAAGEPIKTEVRLRREAAKKKPPESGTTAESTAPMESEAERSVAANHEAAKAHAWNSQ